MPMHNVSTTWRHPQDSTVGASRDILEMALLAQVNMTLTYTVDPLRTLGLKKRRSPKKVTIFVVGVGT